MYEILYEPDIEKQLDKLPKKIYTHVDEVISKLAENPRPYRAEKLVQHKDLYRIRVGDYRVIYKIDDAEKIVIIAKVAKRSEDTYKGL